MNLVIWQEQSRYYHRLRDEPPGRPYRAKCVGIILPWIGPPERSGKKPCPLCF